jgi:Holliday junction resolvase RusA-like endonuclease
MKLAFFIPGRPVPKQSFRLGARGGWQPKRVTDYAKRIRWIVHGAMRRHGWVKPDKMTPLKVRLRFGFNLPVSTRKAHRKKTTLRVSVPDVDNMAKAVLDGCKELWTDDRQVSVLEVVKLNVPRGMQGVTVNVETIDNEDFRLSILSEWSERTGQPGGVDES